MTRFRYTRPLQALLLAVCALSIAIAVGPAALLGSAPAAAAGKARTGKSVTPKHCYATATFKRKTVRVPTSCSKPQSSRKCYLTSTDNGKFYRQQIDCVQSKTSGGHSPATGGATGATGNRAPAPAGDEGVNWGSARAANCDDGSSATSEDGSAGCADGSGPYCTNGTDYVVVDPQNQQVVCLPNASVPASGVCDDGSTPGSGGTDTNGVPMCTDGDDVYLPGDTANDSASGGICDDASNPGDGGTDSSGAPLCADGTAPSYY
jgi:hypothetical protein